MLAANARLCRPRSPRLGAYAAWSGGRISESRVQGRDLRTVTVTQAATAAGPGPGRSRVTVPSLKSRSVSRLP